MYQSLTKYNKNMSVFHDIFITFHNEAVTKNCNFLKTKNLSFELMIAY